MSMNQLLAENRVLRKAVEHWKGQTKRSDVREIRASDAKRIAGDIMRYVGTNKNVSVDDGGQKPKRQETEGLPSVSRRL